MEYSPGLRGVIAGETKISTVGMEGTSLRYRGYDAIKLTETHTYEDAASLIISDDLDGSEFTNNFIKYYGELTNDKDINKLFVEIKSRLHPMDVIRTVVSYIGDSDKNSDLESNDFDDNEIKKQPEIYNSSNEEEVFFDGSDSYDSYGSCDEIKNPQIQENCLDSFL